MRTSLILGMCCAAVLLGAYFASRLLVNDVPPAVVAAPAAGPIIIAPLGLQAVDAPVPSEPATKRLEQAPQRQVAIEPLNKPAGYPRLADNAPQPNADVAIAEVAPSPFQGESKELDYAELMLAQPTVDLERLRSAQEVMARCLEQEPGNKRCLDGLALAKARLAVKGPLQVKPTGPAMLGAPDLARPTPR